MNPIFKCDITYNDSPHLNQIYDGFEKLRQKGIVELKIVKSSQRQQQALLKVVVNDKYNVVYDTLDGFNWIVGSQEENLEYFQKNFEVDYYFKRSYHKSILAKAPKYCSIYPLGLNMNIDPKGILPKGSKENIKNYIKSNVVLSKFFDYHNFKSEFFEYYPIRNNSNKILFLAGLWDPNKALNDAQAEQRKLINESRIDCIESCKREFGDLFIGGLVGNSYAKSVANNLVVPQRLSKRQNFLKIIKQSNICIATTGLHNSIGWKFAEYVAASRAIVSEPLIYLPTGRFIVNENYLSYTNKEELISNVNKLLNDKSLMKKMMSTNFNYYNNYLRSDMLVLKSLLNIKE